MEEGADTTRDHGDETKIVVSVPATAPPLHVWDVLVARSADWWGESYFGARDQAMRMEPHLGGRVFSGDDPDHGSLHGTIRAFDPPSRLEIGGVLVPGAYSGSIVFTIEKSRLGCEIEVEHSARGRIEASVEERISHGWTTMLHDLATLADE